MVFPIIESTGVACRRGDRTTGPCWAIALLLAAGSLALACNQPTDPAELHLPTTKPPGWRPLVFDWLVDPQTSLAIGIADGGPIGDYQHKVHLAVGEPPAFEPVEFFCDPDDVISVWGPEGADVAYMSYLNWERKVDEAAHSVRHVYAGGGLKPFGSGRAPRLAIEVTHRLVGDRVTTTVELQSNYDSPVDVAYVYQDAAVHWLPDSGQPRVGSVAAFDGETLSDRYVLRRAGARDFVLTHHRDHGVAGGIASVGGEAWLGVLPRYAFFGGLVLGPRPPGKLGFADVAAPAGVDALLEELVHETSESFRPERLKVRIVLFRVRDLRPGQRTVLHFWRFGLTAPTPLDPASWAERAAALLDQRPDDGA